MKTTEMGANEGLARTGKWRDKVKDGMDGWMDGWMMGVFETLDMQEMLK